MDKTVFLITVLVSAAAGVVMLGLQNGKWLVDAVGGIVAAWLMLGAGFVWIVIKEHMEE